MGQSELSIQAPKIIEKAGTNGGTTRVNGRVHAANQPACAYRSFRTGHYLSADPRQDESGFSPHTEERGDEAMKTKEHA